MQLYSPGTSKEGEGRGALIKHGINSFVYQGEKQWHVLHADANYIEGLNVDKCTGAHCTMGIVFYVLVNISCVLCKIYMVIYS